MSQMCLYECGGLQFRGHGTFCSVLLTTRCSLHYPTEEDWAQTGLVTVVDVGKCPGPQDGGKCETDLGVPVADV